jgi:ribosomal protein S21
MQFAVALFALFLAVASGFMLHRSPMTQNTALNGVKISLGNEEPIENVLRTFKREVNKSGHLMEMRFKEHKENNHDKRIRKRQRAILLNKLERQQQRYEAERDGFSSEYNS